MNTTPSEVGERTSTPWYTLAVQELQVVGELVVDLEDDRRDEQPRKPK